MNCENIKLALHDYDHTSLSEMKHDAESTRDETITQHLRHCDSCRNLYEQHKQLNNQLGLIPKPKASNALKQRILTERATQQVKHRKQNTFYYTGIAASVCLAVIITLLMDAGNNSQTLLRPEIVATQTAPSSVSAVKNKPSQVNFLIHSEQIIDDVTFILSVPPQIALYGYSDQKTLRWNGKLKLGKNLLTVPVMALSEQTGILVMKISHKNAVKEYRVAVNVRQDHVMTPIETSGQLS